MIASIFKSYFSNNAVSTTAFATALTAIATVISVIVGIFANKEMTRINDETIKTNEEVAKQNNIKIENAVQKLRTTLNLYMEKYEDQVDVLIEIFRTSNMKSELGEIKKVNDLEIMSYVEDLAILSDNCINVFVGSIDYNLTKQQIDDLLYFSNLLKNFFCITNMTKERAKEKPDITVEKYKEELMEEIPHSLRKKCGDVDADFPIFINEFKKLISDYWEKIQEIMDTDKKENK